MFAGNFAPAGWAFCEGQEMPISENDTLFTLIGTTYGGDGQSTFALPNLASRVPIHMGTSPSGTTYQLAEASGTEQETLTVQQIPNHTHPMTGSSDISNSPNPGNSVLARSGQVNMFLNGSTATQMNNVAIEPAGGSQPHENTQPFLCINFIISLFGVFPTQN
jgi:microcystin-dependent protein